MLQLNTLWPCPFLCSSLAAHNNFVDHTFTVCLCCGVVGHACSRALRWVLVAILGVFGVGFQWKFGIFQKIQVSLTMEHTTWQACVDSSAQGLLSAGTHAAFYDSFFVFSFSFSVKVEEDEDQTVSDDPDSPWIENGVPRGANTTSHERHFTITGGACAECLVD